MYVIVTLLASMFRLSHRIKCNIAGLVGQGTSAERLFVLFCSPWYLLLA